MEGARTHSFRIILVSFVFLILGFFLGLYGIHLSLGWRNKKLNQYLPMGASSIMTKRMQAIKAAQKLGKDNYEFEVLGLHPILGKD